MNRPGVPANHQWSLQMTKAVNHPKGYLAVYTGRNGFPRVALDAAGEPIVADTPETALSFAA
jgi:hypothetical protein